MPVFYYSLHLNVCDCFGNLQQGKLTALTDFSSTVILLFDFCLLDRRPDLEPSVNYVLFFLESCTIKANS
jgi:hypothetical protein